MFVDLFTKQEEERKKKGWASLFANLSTQEVARKRNLISLTTQATQAQQQAKEMNSFGGLLKGTLSNTGNTLYNAIGSILLPTATPEELRSLPFLKETAFSTPSAIGGLAKQTVTHPLQTTQNVFVGVARGISDSITNIIVNNFVPKEERENTRDEVKKTLEKYLNPVGGRSNAYQGFEVAGSAAPYIAAGGIAGEAGLATGVLGGSGTRIGGQLAGKIGQVAGTGAGFVGVGQTSLPSESTFSQRAEQATNDLVALGLFEVGTRTFKTAKTQITNAFKAQEEITRRLSVSSETPQETKIPVSTPKTRQTEYAQKMGYEPYKTGEELSTIEMGAKPKVKETLPVIEAGEILTRKTKTGEMVVEPIKTEIPKTEEPVIRMGEELPTPTEKTTRRAGVVKPIEGTGELKTRGLAEGIEAKAIEQKLTNTFGDLPEYKTMDMKDQAQKASDFLASDPQGAVDVAMGRKAPPKDLYPESVLVAVENKATADGDVNTLRELAINSGLSPEATAMGQRIRILGEREPTSPVATIKSVQEARTKNLQERGTNIEQEVQKTTKEIKEEVKNTSSKRSTWEQFINEITCGY